MRGHEGGERNGQVGQPCDEEQNAEHPHVIEHFLVTPHAQGNDVKTGVAERYSQAALRARLGDDEVRLRLDDGFRVSIIDRARGGKGFDCRRVLLVQITGAEVGPAHRFTAEHVPHPDECAGEHRYALGLCFQRGFISQVIGNGAGIAVTFDKNGMFLPFTCVG